MTRRWWIGVVMVLTLTSVLLARQGVVKTKDGRTITGDIDENAGADTVKVTIRDVKISLDRQSIASISYSDNADQEYRDRMSHLAPNDAAGRVEVARWAFLHHQYDLARQAALEAEKIDPKNQDAATLLDTIQTTMAMEARHGSGATPTTGPTPPPPPDNTPPARTTKAHYLSEEQINIIRQFELHANDNVRITFLNNARERYVANGTHDAARFNSETPVQQAMDLIQSGDPQLVHDVRILNDPLAVAEYRTKIQPRVLAGCAASGCHGGASGGTFMLYSPGDSTPAAYTNFFILQTYMQKVDVPNAFPPGPTFRRMIDRTQADQSLLVQYGMPPQSAVTPHPRAPNFKPMFLTDQDPNYKTSLNWIGITLKPFQPDYGIKFDVPAGKPTSRPATAPTP